MKAVATLLSPFLLVLPSFVEVASGQPGPAPGGAAAEAPAVPSATAPASPSAPAAPPTVAPAEPGAPPASPAAPLAPPAVAPTQPVAPAAAAAPASPPAKADDYDGPPLLVGNSAKKPRLGGYGGPTVAYSRMLHRDGVLIGGEGALLIDHRLSLGGAGYAFTRTPSGPPTVDGIEREYFAGYGGFLVRYAVYSDIPVYVSFGLLIGGGALTLAPRYHDDVEHDEADVEVRGFFVTQPDISLHVNATRWLRFGVTGGYRFATAVDDFGYGGDAVGGAIIGGNVQGGWF
jgi:hypothetical protein